MVLATPGRFAAGEEEAPAGDGSAGAGQVTGGLRVLVATRRGQGLRPDDFYWLTDGELVFFGTVCDTGSGAGDGACGCGRAFAGCNSRHGGTTAQVAEWPGTRDDYVAAITAALVGAGYLPAGETHPWASAMADELLEVAAAFPLGAVLERYVDLVQDRLCP